MAGAETKPPVETKTETKSQVDTKPPAEIKAAKTPALPVVKAVHQITYGKGQAAPPRSLFMPASKQEYEDLLRLGAIEEPNEAELALFRQTQPDADLI